MRELLDQWASIHETFMIYPCTGGRAKARNIFNENAENHSNLAEIFHLATWAPKKS